MMKEPILKLFKRAEKNTNKVTLPKAIVEQWGREFYMEVYADHIKLVPVKD